MLRHLLRSSVSTLKRPPYINHYRPSPFSYQFHTNQAARIPIIPFPAFLLGALKTGKLVSIVSISSKTSLTLLPHTFRRGGRLDLFAKVLAGIPLVGFTLLVAVGLDQAPNTSRLRLMYLTEEEQAKVIEAEIEQLFDEQRHNLVSRDTELVMWLQTIVDNLSLVASDDIRDPVRKYDDNPALKSRQIQVVPTLTQAATDVVVVTKEEAGGDYRSPVPHLDLQVDAIFDSSTLNACCIGSQVVVYDMLLDLMDYDTNRMAVILSHEIAHSIQSHFVEQHAFASLLLMLGDILRGVFWMFTESLGPFINQKINESISLLVALETETTYNRRCEKEADLVGLRMMAKAGYDPRVAIEVWERFLEFENYIKRKQEEEADEHHHKVLLDGDKRKELMDKKKDIIKRFAGKSNYIEDDVEMYIGSLLDSWFGSTHPPSPERIEYLRDNMPAAIALYEEALRINGPPREFVFSPQEEQDQQFGLQVGKSFLLYIYEVWSSARTQVSSAIS
ncbi:Metalloendopeptidase OMA1, mitochondrial [Choanephora cucurbitarum]|uniref:Metalloendopeptidase OMA1, mitochondrial n=1 Tax=Choanephora cucurbitarum TaxID=101091 RepID=A0A1C7NRS0_9FUNG|nr:Metalloendopeptidase OMA1, mitochondrial [Choanephora cucurbitarum]